jgi:hypothetical protein
MVEEFEEGLLEDAQNEREDPSQFPDFRLPEDLPHERGVFSA